MQTEAVLFLHVFSSGWSTTTSRLLGPKAGNSSIKYLSQDIAMRYCIGSRTKVLQPFDYKLGAQPTEYDVLSIFQNTQLFLVSADTKQSSGNVSVIKPTCYQILQIIR